jgi:ribosome biogenesis GTPase / thiamine phosphate phosphatase
MPEGIVAAVLGPRCVVMQERQAVQCVLRGKLLRSGVPYPVVVGDRVEYVALGGDQGVVERVHPRRTELRRSTRERLRRKDRRRAPGQEQVVLANAEQVVIVAAAREPGIDLAIIDRALALARSSGLAPAICINKIDLADRAAIERLMAPYLRAGVPVVYVSAAAGSGLDILRALLSEGGGQREGMDGGKPSPASEIPTAPSLPLSLPPALPPSPSAPRVSLFWGGSGVGKSTLTRALTGAEVKIGVWNERNPRGPHTTSDARLYVLPDGGFLADTPGFDWLHLDTLADEEHPQEVLLPESQQETRRCRFADCTHRGEPGCAVTRGVLAGGIDTRRYGRYLELAVGAGLKPAPAMAADRDVAILGGELFHRLRDTDRDDLVEVWTGLGKTSWCYYWPFLRLYGFAPNREVVWREVAGNRCVFVARHLEDGPRLYLLFPPLGPAPERALPECVKLLKAVNGRARAKIMWMDEEDASALRGVRGLRVRSKGHEYWYRPDEILEARGPRFHTVRRQIRRLGVLDDSAAEDTEVTESPGAAESMAEAVGGPGLVDSVPSVLAVANGANVPGARATIVTRPYLPADLRPCLELLNQWNDEQGVRYLMILDKEYTEAALRHYGEFAREELFGGVVEVDGVIRAFFMGGSLTREVGHAFIMKADVSIPGLAYYTHRELLRWLGDHPWVNGGGDLRSEGLRQFKTSFRPAELRPIYQAVLTW